MIETMKDWKIINLKFNLSYFLFMVVAFDIETTGLNPYESKVVLIGMKMEEEIRQWKLWEISDEAKMISEALEKIIKIEGTIIGYNNLKFDVPFMLKRLEVLGNSTERFWEVYNKKWFDLYQYLGNNYRSLSLWTSRAGIEKEHPELRGRDMPAFFEANRFEHIINHNTDDLDTSVKLFKFLKESNPELIPFD